MNRKLAANILLLSCAIFFSADNSFAEVSLSRKLGLKIKTIYIDPAYGGKERGPKLAKNTYGKNITLLVAQKLQARLTEAGFTVYLSREGDQHVPLETRTFRSKAKGTDIYLAIRISNHKKDCIRLFTTTLPKERKPVQNIETKKLNERNSDLNEILKSMQVDDKIEESINLALKLETKLQTNQNVGCIKIQPLYDYILLNTDMPTVIVDFGISNPSHKTPYILNTETQDQVVAVIAASVKEYSDERAPSPTQ
ncbi:MAG TPA: N-acetylmuramoyl-L-alanine amidase [Nitrospirota bacterium]|nr:N-acetylmuramoyl-L-alanine amidase [Nitrospirota bacterium]